jgi:hypothetical protein
MKSKEEELHEAAEALAPLYDGEAIAFAALDGDMVLEEGKIADIIRIAKLRRKGRWVGLRWLWNKLWAWRRV